MPTLGRAGHLVALMAWLLCGGACSLFSLGTLFGEVYEWSYLDRAGAGGGDLRCDLDCVVQVLGLDQIKTTELLFGFCERPVGGAHRAAADPNRGRCLGGLQCLSSYVLAILLDIRGKGKVLVHDRLAVSRRDVGPVLLTLVDQAEILHDASR